MRDGKKERIMGRIVSIEGVDYDVLDTSYNGRRLLHVMEKGTLIGRVEVARVMDDDGEDSFEFAAHCAWDDPDECTSTFEDVAGAIEEVVDLKNGYREKERELVLFAGLTVQE